jgi:glycosyltransferase involved in cell wall biosynthesis
MPSVSIIVPAYNVSSYLSATLHSILAQTFTDWETIVVNDGSTDDTEAIARRYAREDARIRVLSKPNGGISSARNTALSASTSEFIAILDGDDIWLPEYLEAQVAILRARPEVDIVTGNGFNLGGSNDGEFARPFPDTRPQPTLIDIIADETAIFIMSVFRRRVYETIGGFDETLRTNEDYDYWLRAAAAGFRFFRNDRPLCRYRRRNDSLSANNMRMLRGILRVYEKLRPSLARDHAALTTLDRQARRFRAELLTAEAKEAIATGDIETASAHLDALYAMRGGAAVGVAALMARWTPGLLTRAFQFRRARQGATT